MIEEIRPALLGLATCRDLLREPLMLQVRALLDALAAGDGEDALEHYTEIFYGLRQAGKTGLGDWLWDRLRYAESPYPALLDRGGSDPALEGAARRDVETLTRLAGLDCGVLIAAMAALLPESFRTVLEALPRWDSTVPFTFDSLTAFYRVHGAGLFARYRAFLWSEGQLIPVSDPDTPQEEEMMGYGLQREQVIANTRAFLAGKRVNDVLLYGDSGTGKSATVKTLLSVPGFQRLRLIEIEKEGLRDMAALIRSLEGLPQKFILFIDDLAFDQDDRTYSAVKTILEGGLERRPDNVAIYATSNRRLLVRQTFSDRAGDEVDAQETIQEKTALSDRFGLRIPYLALSKGEFLDLIDRLAALWGVELDPSELRRRAIQWDMRVPNRTPRGARQFLSSLQVL